VQTRSFEQRIEELKVFKEAHGHLHVTETLDKNLASFCQAMKQARRKPTSRRMNITEERIKALDDLGFEWGAKMKSK